MPVLLDFSLFDLMTVEKVKKCCHFFVVGHCVNGCRVQQSADDRTSLFCCEGVRALHKILS